MSTTLRLALMAETYKFREVILPIPSVILGKP